jgi:hypothetical protein
MNSHSDSMSPNPRRSPILLQERAFQRVLEIGTSGIGCLIAVQAVAVGGFRTETVETYRRNLRHVSRDLSGAVLTCTGLPIGSKNPLQNARHALPVEPCILPAISGGHRKAAVDDAALSRFVASHKMRRSTGLCRQLTIDSYGTGRNADPAQPLA